jgi:hypothetical protein
MVASVLDTDIRELHKKKEKFWWCEVMSSLRAKYVFPFPLEKTLFILIRCRLSYSQCEQLNVGVLMTDTSFQGLGRILGRDLLGSDLVTDFEVECQVLSTRREVLRRSLVYGTFRDTIVG